jgi:hypothetical protein
VCSGEQGPFCFITKRVADDGCSEDTKHLFRPWWQIIRLRGDFCGTRLVQSLSRRLDACFGLLWEPRALCLLRHGSGFQPSLAAFLATVLFNRCSASGFLSPFLGREKKRDAASSKRWRPRHWRPDVSGSRKTGREKQGRKQC